MDQKRTCIQRQTTLQQESPQSWKETHDKREPLHFTESKGESEKLKSFLER